MLEKEKARKNILVEINNLKKYFPIKSGLLKKKKEYIRAVDDISFKIKKGQIFGLVGESGCGKTTTGRLLVKSIKASAGSIIFRGKDITKLASTDREFRQSVQMIFQDPYQSINPRMTVFDIVSEPLHIHDIGSIKNREKKVIKILNKVGLSPAESFLYRYPHELSGGQRQRLAIARAVIIQPDFIVADEPTSMLDVSLKAQIMELLNQLKQDLGVAYLYITHDLAIARYLCSEIAVMYSGKIVERGETEKIIQNPIHPYTKALISAVPVLDPNYKRESIPIKDKISKARDSIFSCCFYERCPVRKKSCKDDLPAKLREIESEHYVACHGEV